MSWTTVKTHVDDNGVAIEKQCRQRPGRGIETRYLVKAHQGRFIYLSRNQLIDVTDALNDFCDILEEGKF